MDTARFGFPAGADADIVEWQVLIDDRLWSDLQGLLQGMQARLTADAPGPERLLLSSCLDLLRHEADRLEDLRAGRSRLLPQQVHLSAWSFNKGRLEIGGAWQEGTDLGRLAFQVTQEAYRLNQQTRPALP